MHFERLNYGLYCLQILSFNRRLETSYRLLTTIFIKSHTMTPTSDDYDNQAHKVSIFVTSIDWNIKNLTFNRILLFLFLLFQLRHRK